MTQVDQIALATEKVTRWRGKCEHAASMLSKWEARLSALQPEAKPQPTAKKLPRLTLVPAVDDAAKVVTPSPKGKPKKK